MVLTKDFGELFSPQKLSKKEITFKAFNPEKSYRKSSDKRCKIHDEILTLLKLMVILRPELCLEF